MLPAFSQNILPITRAVPLAFALALLIPSLAMAASESQLCTDAHLQIEHTQMILRASEQRQQQLQQDVRAIYRKLFACQTGIGLSLAGHQHCAQLEKEAPKQFQAMVKSITFTHQTSQQLVHQTSQAQLTCPQNSENLLAQKTSMTPLQKFAINN